jgi:hypothetical protein
LVCCVLVCCVLVLCIGVVVCCVLYVVAGTDAGVVVGVGVGCLHVRIVWAYVLMYESVLSYNSSMYVSVLSSSMDHRTAGGELFRPARQQVPQSLYLQHEE